MKAEESFESVNPGAARMCAALTCAASLIVTTVGMLVLVGWLMHIRALTSLIPDFAMMRPNTALCFALGGGALWFWRFTPNRSISPRSRTLRAAQACGALVALIGGLTLCEHLLGVNFGIDEVLFHKAVAAAQIPQAGRMAPATAFNFFALGLALMFLHVKWRHVWQPAQWLALIALMVGVCGILGYVYAVKPPSLLSDYNSMAVHTATLFIVLCIGTLCCRPDWSAMSILISTFSGGLIARRILPVTVTMLFLLGWLGLWGEHAGLYGTEFDAAIFTISNVVVFTTVVILCGRTLNQLDAMSAATAASMRRTDADLKRRAHEMERRFRFLSDRIPLIIWTSQPDGKVDYYNQRWFDYTGMTPEQTQGRGMELVVHPDDLQNCVDRWTDSFTTGCDYEVEYRFRRAIDGEYRWHLGRASPLRDEHGEIIQWIGTCTDIEDQKRARAELAQRVAERTAELSHANAALEEKQQFLEVLVNNLEVGLTASDAEGRVTLLNRTVREFNNLPPDGPVPDIPIWERPARYGLYYAGGTELMRPEDMPMYRALCGESVRELEYVINPPGGTCRLVVASGQPIVAADGRKLGAVVAIRDITQRKQAEADLRAAKENAEEANYAKSRFLANMSHEIRTPMNGVIGMTSLLLDTHLDTEQRNCVETIRKSGESLLTVINDILDFSKIEAGKIEFETLDYDLQEVVDGTLELLAEAAQSKGLELAGFIEPSVPRYLRGDAGRLRQVLANLAGNAIKFTARGEVIVRVSRESSTDTTAVLHFEVNDTGIGISPEAQQHLFEAFSQADVSTTRKYGGTGLGLAISQQFVQMMGGLIVVQSSPGHGSSFSFSLPVQMQPDPRPIDSADHVLTGARVVIADAHPTTGQFLQSQLAAWQIPCALVTTGPQALDVLRTAVRKGAAFSIVILDHSLPEMDDLALARAIKADPSIAAVRLILLNPRGKRLTEEELKSARIAHVCYKPVRQSALFDALADAPAAMCENRSNGQRRKERILLAEDNAVNQMVALGLLRKLGYAADAVANGFEVLQALEQIPYDIVLMDCHMPEMDGYEATAAIRQREGTSKHTWIIALTASAMIEGRERCFGVGMDDYLSKPVCLADLAAALGRAQIPVSRDKIKTSVDCRDLAAEDRRS